jgi:RNA polymerase sigma-70 factor (ECF subfamily)
MDYRTLSSQELIQQCVTTYASAAWQEFIRRFQPLMAGVVARTAMRWTKISPSLVDDLVQESYLKLCANQARGLREFQSRHEHAIYGFLKLVAYNVTMDYFKEQYASKRGKYQLTDSDPELVLQTKGQMSTAEDQVFMREIDDLINRLAANHRDKAVFLLYYRQGFSAKAIAKIPGISLTPKGVESCVHRLTVQLREHLAKNEKLKRRK